MRITLTHPYTWPYVQRGGERLFHDLAVWLASAGHDVTTISAVPTHGGRQRREGLLAVEHRGLAPHALRRVDVDQAVTYLPAAAWTIRREPPDVFHGLSYLDGIAGRLGHRPPTALHLQGMPVRRSLANRPAHRRLFPQSVKGADLVLTVSHAAARAAQQEFGIPARGMHNGVFVADFAGADPHDRAPHPTVLFPGAVDDLRKRLDLLVEAMQTLRATWPGLVLAVAARTDAEQRARLRARLDDGVEFLDVRSPEAMGAAYTRAWVTGLPAVREAFGLVFVESLASGTPVVGVRDGGVPEVVTETSWLAEVDDAASLVRALDRALTDAQADGIAERCRALAAPFDWSVRGPEFVAMYEELLNSAPTARRRGR